MFAVISKKQQHPIRVILMRALYWLCPEWFPSRKELEDCARENNALQKIITETYLEGQTNIQMLVRALQESRRQLEMYREQNERLLEHATRDYLTGAFNRRGANVKFMEQVSLTQRTLNGMLVPFPCFGVIALDLDNFKKVNDTFGHDTGDQVLVTVVDIIKGIFHRDTDIVCRSGGDEFLITVSNGNLVQAVIRAETLRVAITCDSRLRFDGFSVTASVGV